MFSSYQVQPTHHADLSLSIHDRINDLGRRAERLAPAVAHSASESGCTDIRPTGPRQAKAWDMCAEALSWNLIADEPTLVAAAEGFEAEGMAYTARWDWAGAGHRTSVMPTVGAPVVVTDRLGAASDTYEAAGLPWTSSGGRIWPSGSSYDADCAACVGSLPHTHEVTTSITYVDRQPVLGDGYAWTVTGPNGFERGGLCHSYEDAERMAARAVAEAV